MSSGRPGIRVLSIIAAVLIFAYSYRDLARSSFTHVCENSDPITNTYTSGNGIENELGNVNEKSESDGVKSHDPSTSVLSHLVALTTPATAYPTDYLTVYKEDDNCALLFGPRYLEYMASHHIEYCEKDSRSSFECFRTYRKETFCVGKGVVSDLSRGDGPHTSMHCKMRNFTKERKYNSVLQDVLDFEEQGRGFYDTTARCQLEHWDINTNIDNARVAGQVCDKEYNDGKWTLLVKRENHPNIWHKMLEIWQSLIVLDVLQMAINPATKAPYLKATDIPNVQVVFTEGDKGTLNPVDDWWEMITGKKPVMQKDMPPTCLGNVILPLDEVSSPFWDHTWDMGDCHEPFLVNAFLKRLYRYIGLEQEYQVNPKGEMLVTIIDRKGTRKLRHQDEMVATAQARWPKVKFQLVDFANTTLLDQVKLVRDTDILLGLTGAGMTHIFWLPEESSVAEIQAPGVVYGGFRHLCKLRNLNYFTVLPEKKNPEDMVTEGADWQLSEWVDVKNDAFQSMVDAAINAQLHKGTRWYEVQHKEE
jgi:protein O-GlcNAc transferase